MSATIAAHYARARGVPQDNRVHITIDPKDEVTRADYERLIEAPIAQWIARNAAQDRILYIVLTKGVPLRIARHRGPRRHHRQRRFGADAALSQDDRRAVPAAGTMANPYFLGDTPVAQAKPFSHQAYDIYLVTRLDGFTESDVLGLIDRGAAPSREGTIVLDGKAACGRVRATSGCRRRPTGSRRTASRTAWSSMRRAA